MLLLHALTKLSRLHGRKLPIVLHVNYRLRGQDSEDDELLVRDEAANLGLDIRVKQIASGEQPSSGIQAWARLVRREFFEAQLKDADLVALAHHRDDLTENVLMKLARGSGLRVAGMRFFKAPYWRPLLGISKAELYEMAAGQKVAYREDASNAKLIYSRNLMRTRVIPEIEQIYSGFSKKLAAYALDLEDIVDTFEAEFGDKWLQDRLKGSLLREHNRGTSLWILANFISYKVKDVQLTRAQLERIWQVVMDRRMNWSEELSGDKKLVWHNDILQVVNKNEALNLRASQHKANIRSQHWHYYIEEGASLIGPQGSYLKN